MNTILQLLVSVVAGTSDEPCIDDCFSVPDGRLSPKHFDGSPGERLGASFAEVCH
jgi:hypothetical protein